MKKNLTANIIRDINKVIKSQSSILSKEDLERLIKSREGLRNAKTKKTKKKYLAILLKVFEFASTVMINFKT